jgi:hypothetical protein
VVKRAVLDYSEYLLTQKMDCFLQNKIQVQIHCISTNQVKGWINSSIGTIVWLKLEYGFQSESDIVKSVCELESLGLSTPTLNEFNDGFEISNLIENLKQMYFQDYKSNSIFTD